MSARQRIRDEFRMAYPASHSVSKKWGECVWTADDVLLASYPHVATARVMSGRRGRSAAALSRSVSAL